MTTIKLAEVVNGFVKNIAVFDQDSIPSWASSWVSVDDTADIGSAYDGSSFSAPDRSDEVSKAVRDRRDAFLAESDWVVTKAIEQNAMDGLGVQIPVVWLDYRQALRDIPQQPGFPDNVTWPTAP
jgi:hypothetical protein